MFQKIKNPNAKFANIALAILYVVVLSALFVCALKWQSSDKCECASEIVKPADL